MRSRVSESVNRDELCRGAGDREQSSHVFIGDRASVRVEQTEECAVAQTARQQGYMVK